MIFGFGSLSLATTRDIYKRDKKVKIKKTIYNIYSEKTTEIKKDQLLPIYNIKPNLANKLAKTTTTNLKRRKLYPRDHHSTRSH